MYVSIFTDELGLDITEGLPIIKEWGLHYIDLRGRVFGCAAENLPAERLPELRGLLDKYGFQVGCLQSSLAKVHLPDADRQKAEEAKLEGIIRAADALDCRLVRAFHYWQPKGELKGELAVRPDALQKVLDMFGPLAERARRAGLTLTFENCGVQPDEVFAVLDALDMPDWGLAWDVHNTWACDERRRDEDAFIRRMLERAKLLHVKARGAVAEAGAERIPYAKVLKACAQAALPGPVSAETHTREVQRKIEVSRQVVDVIRQAWPAGTPGNAEKRNSAAAKPPTRPWHDDPVGFAVVGLGLGHVVAQRIANTSGTRLVGVCYIDEARARRTAEACGARYATDLRVWLADDEVEAVFVATPTGLHAKIALEALDAGKHVLTTKPMEASIAACDEMIARAEQKQRLLGVDFNRRFSEHANTLRHAVANGHFGRLLSGTCSLKIQRKMGYFRQSGGWRGTRKLDGGGVLSNQAIHHIDELAFTVGIPAKVRCDIWTQNHDIEAEDLGSAAWLYENGLVITLSATSSYPHRTWYHHYELEGTDGAYFQARGGPFGNLDTRWFSDGAWTETPPAQVASPWRNGCDNFAAALRTGAKLTCSGRDGRRSQAVLDAMYRSAYEANGDWVEVAS